MYGRHCCNNSNLDLRGWRWGVIARDIFISLVVTFFYHAVSLQRFFGESPISRNLCNKVWGAFNPYPIEAIKAGGKFIPLRPFSSLTSVGYYAGLFGSIALVKCTASGGLALARNKLDVCNDLVGVAAVYSYASYLFGSEKRVKWNNRCLAGMAIGSIVYANTAP